MSDQAVPDSVTMTDRLRERFGPRAVAVALALLVELLLALILLTLAPAILTPKEPVPMSAFDVSVRKAEPVAEKAAPQKTASAPRPAAQPAPQPADPQPRPVPPRPDTAPPVMLDIPLGRMPDIGALPRGPAAHGRAAGPFPSARRYAARGGARAEWRAALCRILVSRTI